MPLNEKKWEQCFRQCQIHLKTYSVKCIFLIKIFSYIKEVSNVNICHSAFCRVLLISFYSYSPFSYSHLIVPGYFLIINHSIDIKISEWKSLWIYTNLKSWLWLVIFSNDKYSAIFFIDLIKYAIRIPRINTS